MQFMGYVEDVGEKVKNVKKGDRVVAAFDLGCGACMCAVYSHAAWTVFACCQRFHNLPASTACLHM